MSSLAKNENYDNFLQTNCTASDADIINFPSGLKEQLPYQIEIEDWVDKSPIIKPGVCKIDRSIVDMVDLDTDKDSRFVFQKVTPFNQKWETSTDRTLPLGIRIKGFDRYWGIKLADAGIHNRTVGTNQEQGHSLLHDAQASLMIIDEDDRKQRSAGESTCLPSRSNLIGYSMGSMKLFAMLGLAPKMGREIDFSIGIDPCLVEEFDYSKELSHPFRLAEYLGAEALEVPKNMLKDIHLKSLGRDMIRTLHLLSSFGITPEYAANTSEKWSVLATAETKAFPPLVPRSAVAIVHFLDRCKWNNSPIYDKLFDSHPNVRRIHEDGLHLSAANPRVIKKIVQKNVEALDLIDEGVSDAELADALVEPIL